MQRVQNLEQITHGQIDLADKIAAFVRLGATVLVLLLGVVAGKSRPAIAAAAAFFALGIFSLMVGVLLSRGKSSAPLYIPSLVLDVAALVALGYFALADYGFPGALASLIILEGYCTGIILLSALRLSLRDVAWAGGAVIIAPAAVAGIAVFDSPEGSARALFFIPVLNGLIGTFVALLSHRSRNALRENLVTEDLLKGTRRLKMTLDIVAASIFNLRQLVDRLGAVSATVSAAARNQAANIRQVTDAAEKLRASMEELSHSTDRSAVSVSRTAQFIEKGTTIMQKIAGEISGIHDVVDKMAAALARIDDIADQTNLLAFNASIEASRAAEGQSGFPVVEDEIRRLAEKSARAASEVSAWVKQIESVVDEGGESSREAGAIFASIAHDLGSHAGFIRGLSASVKEQAGVNREVTGAIEGFTSVVEENRDTAESVSRITEDLKREMVKLDGLVGEKIREVEQLFERSQPASPV